MTIAALVGVKDEVELIDLAVDHLRLIGVDRIIACDFHSTDGTAAILDRRAQEGELEVVRMSDSVSQEDWSRQALALAAATGAEWVTFLDADELPVPASGSLRDTVDRARADVLTVDRYNVALAPSGPLIPNPLLAARATRSCC